MPALAVAATAATLCTCIQWQPTEPTTGKPPVRADDSEEPVSIPQARMVAVSSLGPYFADVFGGEAALALAEDRIEEAMRLFDEIAREITDPVLTPRARFLATYLAQRSGDDARALAELPGLAEQLPELADTAHEIAAEAALRMRKYDTALALAKAVAPEGTAAPEAAMIAADSMRRLERWPQAAQAYRDYMERWPTHSRGREALARLTESLTRIALDGDEVDRTTATETLELIERLRVQDPRDIWTRVVGAHERELREALDLPDATTKQESAEAQKAFDRARQLLNQKRNKEAEKAFAKASRLAIEDGDLQCRARLNQAIAVARQRQHGRAASLFDELASDCQSPNVRVRALYKGGRSYIAADRLQDSIRLFETVEEQFPEHSYADDARLRRARCHLALGDRETFKELITSLPVEYPTGDMRAEALWAASSDALEQKDIATAHEILEQYYALFPDEDGWYAAGRSGYWLGRVAELLGNSEEAANRYAQVIASAPLAHYMILAHARLTAIDESRAATLIARLAPPGGELSARFAASLLETEPRLATGIELLRLGLTTRARREFDDLLGDSRTPAEVHWIASALFRRMGQYTDATRVAGKQANGWSKRYPAAADLVRWTLAYPTAYEDAVRSAAAESGVDPALLWAVMREESGFNSEVESWANAIGLMQLIMSTAKSMGRRLDIKVTKKALRQPETNIRLGAAYLAFLADKFDGRIALMVAGYNAGEGAVNRWLEAKPDVELDEFVEQIPYHQTRGYTKRVLSTYATYKFLYEENRPVFLPELTLP